MSIPPAALVFESGINTMPSNSMEPNSLDTLVRRQLEAASRELASRAKFTTVDSSPEQRQNIINDVGEYLAQTAQMWLSLTDRLVQGPHVTLAAEEAHEQSYNKTHMADLQPIATMDMNISKLGKIRDLAERFSADVQEVWRRTPEPGVVVSAPTYQTASSFHTIKSEPVSWPQPSFAGSDVDAGTRGGQRTLLASQSTDDMQSPGGNGSASDDSGEDEDEQFSKIDMDALKQRGKGSYYCPLGHRCDKGGVDKEGKLVLFDRNSSFAQHCNKHRKPWRCDVPGCPNPPKKRKFARRDGLERHKLTVKHRVITS
ncbi:Ff.00g046580.m01.CDS01 [Fusarium sp. VM40]|nr:Ff.00g046580.m01.CDS01 [Fusarium sp. VM40]